MTKFSQPVVAVLFGALALGAFTHAHAQATASPYTTGYRFDAARRLTGEISADPDGSGPLPFIAIRNTYDTYGNLSKVEYGTLSTWQAELVAPANWSGFTVHETVDQTYDQLGNATRETRTGVSGMVSRTDRSYDTFGRRRCTATRVNLAAAIPADACVATASGAYGVDQIQRVEYDSRDRPIQIRGGVGTAAERSIVTYVYTADSQVQQVIDGNGNRSTFEFDGFSRPIKLRFPVTAMPTGFNGSTAATAVLTAGLSSTVLYEEYGLDGNGNRISWRRRSGQTILYAYDALNRLSIKNLPGGTTQDVYYGYDMANNMTFARFGSINGAGVVNTFNNAGRPLTTLDIKGATSRTITRTFDRNGNRLVLTHPGGTQFSYQYDGLNRWIDLSYGTVLPGQHLIGYDAPGRRASYTRTFSGSSTTYQYDAVSRLATLTHGFTNPADNATFQYTYSPASQIVGRSVTASGYDLPQITGATAYTRNGLNQYSAINGANLTYDDDGNLTSDGSVTYTYDAEGRLLTLSGARSATITYDPLGRLATLTSAAGTQTFLYDGDDLILSYGANSAILGRFVHGSGLDEPVIQFASAGGFPIDLYADERGSVIGTTSPSPAHFAYDAFGMGGPGTSSVFGFGGQVWLEQAGLYYFKSRMYQPALGRFLQPDGVTFTDNSNLYAYTANNPINAVDPDGRSARVVIDHGKRIVMVIVPITIRPGSDITYQEVSDAVSAVSQTVVDSEGNSWQVNFGTVPGSLRDPDTNQRYTNEVYTDPFYYSDQGRVMSGFRRPGGTVIRMGSSGPFNIKATGHELGAHPAGIADVYNAQSQFKESNPAYPNNLMNNDNFTPSGMSLQWWQVRQMFDPNNGNDVQVRPLGTGN